MWWWRGRRWSPVGPASPDRARRAQIWVGAGLGGFDLPVAGLSDELLVTGDDSDDATPAAAWRGELHGPVWVRPSLRGRTRVAAVVAYVQQHGGGDFTSLPGLGRAWLAWCVPAAVSGRHSSVIVPSSVRPSMSSSSSLIQGISISVSDDDEALGKVRVRVRRKRNRQPGSARRRFLRRAARWGAPLFLAFLAVCLFAYEYYRLSSSSPPPPAAGNLSRVDRATRAADGTRKVCLKMLDREMLQNLELPETAEQNLPVKIVVYRSSLPHLEDNISSNMTNSRFNSFTGYQTLPEREENFKPKEITAVHCGFYSENGGFRVSDVDEDYMKSCKVVVATCAFGGGDDLHQPIGMTEVSLKKVCYVAFWDEVTRSAQEEEGNKIGEDLMIGLWRIILVRDLPFADQRLNGKIPKLISHRLFPMARYSIWVDSKSQFRRDPLGVIEALLWRSNSSLALSEHGARSSLYDEGKAIVKKHKATPEEVKIQLDQYRQDGIPDDKRFNGKKALAEASVIVRDHAPLTNLFMCLWFNEVVRFTSRDQLSFPYVLRRLRLPGVHLFPVCARKDLVNSFGHRRKVKPLAKDGR